MIVQAFDTIALQKLSPRQQWRLEDSRLTSLEDPSLACFFISPSNSLSAGRQVLEVVHADGIVAVGNHIHLARHDRSKSTQLFRRQYHPPGSGLVVARVCFPSLCCRALYDNGRLCRLWRTGPRAFCCCTTVKTACSRGRYRAFRLFACQLSSSFFHSYPLQLLSNKASTHAATDVQALRFSETIIDLRLPTGLGLSFIDDRPQELIFVSARGIRLSVSMKETLQTASLEVEHFQVRQHCVTAYICFSML